jgi:hypothetical protein
MSALAELAPSEWVAKTLKEKLKRRNKTRNLMDPNQLLCSHADAAKHLCHHVGLHLALSHQNKSRICVPGSHNHCGNVCNLKITQYRFRSSFKI